MSLPVESAKGRVILLTGANRGIGLATTRELKKRGAVVVAGVRDSSTMPSVDGIDVLLCDTADAESCRNYVRHAMKAHGRVDGLINNAAILVDDETPALKLSEQDLRRVIEVNLIGPFRLCQLVLPGMIERRYGRIVNISSGLGAINGMGGGYASYRMTKLALNGLTRVLAAEIGTVSNVKVNSLSPGWVRTDMGGVGASRAPEDAASEIADLVSISESGPSGSFFSGGEPVNW